MDFDWAKRGGNIYAEEGKHCLKRSTGYLSYQGETEQGEKWTKGGSSDKKELGEKYSKTIERVITWEGEIIRQKERESSIANKTELGGSRVILRGTSQGGGEKGSRQNLSPVGKKEGCLCLSRGGVLRGSP